MAIDTGTAGNVAGMRWETSAVGYYGPDGYAPCCLVCGRAFSLQPLKCGSKHDGQHLCGRCIDNGIAMLGSGAKLRNEVDRDWVCNQCPDGV